MGAPQYEQAGADIGGTGTTNTIPRWTGPSTLGDSLLIQTSNAITMTSTVNARLDFGVRNLANGGSAYSQLFAGNDTDVLAGLLRNSSGNAGYAGPNSLNLWTVGAFPIGFVTGNQLRAIVDASGNVGIGTASPLAKLHTLISGTAVVSAGSDPAPGTLFEGTNTALTTGATSTQQLAIMSNSAVAADAGGGLVLGGKYTGNAYANFAAIKSGKDNATGAEYGGYLAFYTRTNGQAGVGERARIDSAGRLLVGTSTAPGSTAVRSVLASNSSVYAGVQNTGTNVGCAFGVGAANFELYTSSGVYGVETYTQRMAVSSAGTQAQSQVAIGTGLFTSGCSLTVTQSIDASQSGQGLKLPATPGNTDPNTLDAYRDGGTAGSGGVSFTATLKGLVSDPTTPVTATGKYILVGKLLVMTIVFSNVNTTGAAGAIYVQTDLAAALRPERNCVGAVTLDSIATITGVGTHVIANTGGDIYVAQNTSNAAVSFCTHNAGAARGLTITVSYMIP